MKKTAEQTAKEILSFLRLYVGEDVNEHAVPNIAKMIEECASSQPVVKQLSDEQINELAIKQEYLGDNCFEGYELGMKAYRDLLCSK